MLWCEVSSGTPPAASLQVALLHQHGGSEKGCRTQPGMSQTSAASLQGRQQSETLYVTG